MNATDPDESTFYPNLTLKVITSVFAVFGIPGNLLVISLIGQRFRKRKPFEWLLFNLALVDLVQCLNNLCLQVPFIGQYDTPQCHAAGFIQYLVGLQSFLVPPLIAYNRYLSLHSPYQCDRVFTRLTTGIMCILTWLVSAAVFLPFALTDDLGEDDFGLCGLRRKLHGQQLQWPPVYFCLLASVRVVVALCYITLFLCSYRIIVRLRNHVSRASPSIQSRLIDESKELVTLTILLFLVPFLTQSPAVTIKIAILFAPEIFTPNLWVSRLLIVTFAMPAAIDPYMTLYIVKEYRRKVTGCLKR